MEDDNARERPLAVPRPETGEARVDAALSLLDELTELPVTEHPAMFEQVQAQLSEVLGELGSRPLPGPAGRDRRLSELAATGLSTRMSRRLRLDAELVRRGLARSREQAAELIAAGRVEVGGSAGGQGRHPGGRGRGDHRPAGGDRAGATCRAAGTSWPARSPRSAG